MKKNRLVEQHLYLPKGERNGILLFFILSIIGIIIFRQLTKPKNNFSIVSTTVISESNVMKDSKWSNPKKSFHHKNHKYSEGKIKREKFLFNPNTLPKDSLLLLGFTKSVVENIYKYKNKGGKINSPEHFKKIYGIDTALVTSLVEYTIFSENTQKEKITEQNDSRETNGIKLPTSGKREDISIRIELNEADSTQLVSLKGIGPYYAKKILQMKKTLGGYAYTDQIRECQVIPDSVYFKIKDFVWVDTSKMEKLKLNDVNYRILIQHPYFEENLVKVILNYKENHGPFTSITQLKNIKLLTREKYEKIIKHFKI